MILTYVPNIGQCEKLYILQQIFYYILETLLDMDMVT